MNMGWRIILPVLTGSAFIASWYLALWLGWIQAFTIPPPHRILIAIFERRQEMTAAGLTTFAAALNGFAVAVLGGFSIATMLSLSIWVRAAIHPYVLVIQMTPIIVLIPIIGLLIPDPALRIMLITFLISFFPVVANTILGFTSTEQNLIDLFRVHNSSRLQELLLLRIPFAVPYFLTGVKIAATLAPIGAITGDFLLGTSRNPGLGYLLVTYYSRGENAALFGIALLASLIGFVFVGAVYTVTHLSLRKWHDSSIRRG